MKMILKEILKILIGLVIIVTAPIWLTLWVIIICCYNTYEFAEDIYKYQKSKYNKIHLENEKWKS